MSASAARPLPSVGAVIGGKLRLVRALGEGGMGVVFEASHEILERSVAVKVMRPEASASALWTERFLREARVLIDLENPHTTRVFDAGLHEDHLPYIVMELLAGDDLAAVVRRDGPAGRDLAIRWILEACDALHEAHDKGIVHRDLKPSNLFLQTRKDGTSIKLLDFGIAKRLAKSNAGELDLTDTGMTMGSPRYAAPEQLHDARQADARTDIWGIGVTLYELASGRQAFAGDSLAIVVTQIMTMSPDYTALPPDLAKVVDRCVQREPADRYPTILALAADLLALLSPKQRPRLELTRAIETAATKVDTAQSRIEAPSPRAAEIVTPAPSAPVAPSAIDGTQFSVSSDGPRLSAGAVAKSAVGEATSLQDASARRSSPWPLAVLVAAIGAAIATAAFIWLPLSTASRSQPEAESKPGAAQGERGIAVGSPPSQPSPPARVAPPPSIPGGSTEPAVSAEATAAPGASIPKPSRDRGAVPAKPPAATSVAPPRPTPAPAGRSPYDDQH